ncbi:MAG: hypothetical protein Q9166_002979 [cf. Caloplaca sp. 2 TL-2023]
MPRPKRTKLAPSIPIIPAAIASKKAQPKLDVSPASVAVSSSHGMNGSDDSEGIVTKSKTGVNRRGIAPQAVFMSGGLAVEDVGAKRPRPLSSKKRVELSRIAREGDYANVHAHSKSRRNAGFAAERLAKDAKGGIQNQSTQPRKAPIATVAPTQIPKIQATPIRENSVLVIDNSKRRPRQPSLLQIAQAHIAATESEDDNTLDDFNPDDESTPFKDSHPNLQQDTKMPSYRQSSSRKRKLSTPEVQVSASQSRSSPDQPSSPPEPGDLFELIAEDSQPNPPLPAIPVDSISLVPKAVNSDTLAPPQSSSLPASPQKQRDYQPKTRTKQTQMTSKPKLKPTTSKSRKQSSPVLPPRSPSPIHSSPSAVSPTRSPLKPLTTSALQNLLPQRRRAVSSRNKEKAVFDLNSSDEVDSFHADEDEDELNYHPSTKPTRKAGTEKPKRGRAKASKKGKGDSNAANAKTMGKQGGPRLSTTYTRKSHHAEAGNENAYTASGDESGEDEHRSRAGSVLRDVKAKEEMKKMAAKFREVDDWGLEFEEVTGSSDRMRDAR